MYLYIYNFIQNLVLNNKNKKWRIKLKKKLHNILFKKQINNLYELFKNIENIDLFEIMAINK